MQTDLGTSILVNGSLILTSGVAFIEVNQSILFSIKSIGFLFTIELKDDGGNQPRWAIESKDPPNGVNFAASITLFNFTRFTPLTPDPFKLGKMDGKILTLSMHSNKIGPNRVSLLYQLAF